MKQIAITWYILQVFNVLTIKAETDSEAIDAHFILEISSLLSLIQDVYPMRTKSLNFCKMPTVVNGFMEIAKFFMKEKTKNRVSKSTLHGFDRFNKC